MTQMWSGQIVLNFSSTFVIFGNLDLILIICVNFLGQFILNRPALALFLYTPLWIPQIISNICSGAKRVPKLAYIFFFSLMRLYPLVSSIFINFSSTWHYVLWTYWK